MRIRFQEDHGHGRWVVDYRDGRGKRRQESFADRADAADFATTVPEPRNASGPTLSIDDLLDSYFAATAARRKPGSQKGAMTVETESSTL